MTLKELCPNGIPFGSLLLCVLAAVLYACMLVQMAEPRAAGDAVVGQAFGVLFTVAGLWIVLAALVIAAAVFGKMPRWTWLAIILVPLAAVATVIALDAVSSDHDAMMVFPICLPVIVAGAGVQGRLQRPPGSGRSQLALWAGVAVLSLGALLGAS